MAIEFPACFNPSLSFLCLRAPYDAVTNLKPGAAGGQQTPEYSNVMLYRRTHCNSMNEEKKRLPRKPSSLGNYYCNCLHTPPITEMNNKLAPLTGSSPPPPPSLAAATYRRARELQRPAARAALSGLRARALPGGSERRCGPGRAAPQAGTRCWPGVARAAERAGTAGAVCEELERSE